MRPAIGRGFATVLVLIAFTQNAHAASIINLYNGPNLVDGTTTYLDVYSLQLQLSFASVRQFPDDEFNILEDVDLSTSPFGTTTGDLTLIAPSVNFLGDVIWGLGKLTIESASFNLQDSIAGNGLFWDGGSSGVLDVGGDSQVTLIGGPLGAQLNVAANAGAELIGYGFQLDTGSGFASVGFGALASDTGVLRGFLESGDAFEIAFDHDTTLSSIVLTAVPVPAAVWLFGSALAGLGWLRRRR